MNQVCWWLTDIVSRTLDPAERIAVHGDLLESGQNGGAAVFDVLGLVVRRQLALWKSWQPWLALLGVAGISGVVLSAVAFNLRVGMDHRLLRYLQSGTYSGNDVSYGQEIAFLICLSIALFAWTWTSSFVLATLSRRSLWVTGLMFYIVVQNSFLARLVASGAIDARYPIVGRHPLPLPVVFLVFLLPTSPSKVLFLLAAIWGARSGLRKRLLGLRQMATWAVLVIVLTALVMWTGGWYQHTRALILPWVGTSPDSWRGGVWHAGAWPARLFPLLLVSWPAVYMVATSWQLRNKLSNQFQGSKA